MTLDGIAIAAAVLVNAACAAWHVRARRRLAAMADEAADTARIAFLQALTLAECGELLCEDCHAIVSGHYQARAAPAIAEFYRRRPE